MKKQRVIEPVLIVHLEVGDTGRRWMVRGDFHCVAEGVSTDALRAAAEYLLDQAEREDGESRA